MRIQRLFISAGFGLSLIVALILGVQWQADITFNVHAQGDNGGVQSLDATAPVTRSLAVPYPPQVFLPLILSPVPPIYLPLVTRFIPRPVLPPPLPPPIPMTGTPPIDFETIRAELQADKQDLAFVKIGFHVGPGGNVSGLVNALTALDAAGVPFFLKSVDTTGQGFFDAQQLAQNSGVPHTLVYRKSGLGWDLPDYNLPPREAAYNHWVKHRDAFPPELDPSLVWIETVNEVDKGRSEWLAEFALETARLALDDGFRWAAFGWSSGEPEPEHWQGPKMLEFLQLVGEHPDRLAIALHEYSYTVDYITSAVTYPYWVGRFQHLFQICDENGIPRPTVLITEWGWENQNVPDVPEAMDDITWASWLYAAYPQVQGAAIWYLGGGSEFGDIANQAQRLIAPWKDYASSNYFIIVQGQGRVDPEIFRPPDAN